MSRFRSRRTTRSPVCSRPARAVRWRSRAKARNLVAQVVVTDSAGNSATFTSPAVKIDRSAPVVNSTITGTAGNDGWYRSDVQVAWTVTEDRSTSTNTGCSTSSVLTDTTEVTFTCTATSAGSTTKSVTIKVDETPPTLTFGAASPAPDDAGWRASPVSVPFTASDALSGVASTSSPSPLAITQTSATVPSGRGHRRRRQQRDVHHAGLQGRRHATDHQHAGDRLRPRLVSHGRPRHLGRDRRRLAVLTGQ